jgi:hypothetical protein
MNHSTLTLKKPSFSQQVATELQEVNAVLVLALCALQHNQHPTEVFDTLALVQSRLSDLQTDAELQANTTQDSEAAV